MKILVVSDVHANRVALESVIKHAGKFDKVWCLGDIVGYGPEPNECVDTLRAFDLLCLAGNHDWAVLNKLDLDEFNPEARRAALWTRETLTPSNFNWLIALPERVPPQLENFTLTHGSPQHPIWEYVATPGVARINFHHFQTPICLIGHTHVPVVFRYHAKEDLATAEALPEDAPLDFGPERMMINPGSVGQPRDGDRRAAYAMLDTDTMQLTHRRIEYDVNATQEKMHKVRLPERLIARLSYGW
jgi:predicted phosphodiesterase